MNDSKQAIYIVYYQWLKIISMSTGMIIPKQMGSRNSDLISSQKQASPLRTNNTVHPLHWGFSGTLVYKDP